MAELKDRYSAEWWLASGMKWFTRQNNLYPKRSHEQKNTEWTTLWLNLQKQNQNVTKSPAFVKETR